MRKHEARQLLKLAQALVRGLLRYQYSSSTAGDLSGDPRFVDRYRVQKPVYEKLPEIEAPPGEGIPLRESGQLQPRRSAPFSSAAVLTHAVRKQGVTRRRAFFFFFSCLTEREDFPFHGA